MAAVQRTLVHKQFNSPMGLYSPQNVKETLDRELKAFGASGIEIDDQNSKPLNLANSAVLRAVEEEEEMKCGYKRVAWPPVSEERIAREFTPQPQRQFSPSSPPQQQQQQQQQQPAAAPVSGSVPAPHQQPNYRANSYDHYQPPTVQQQQQHQQPSPPQKYQAVSNLAQYNHQPQQQPQQPYQYRAQSQQHQSAVPSQQQPNWSAQSQQQQPAYHAQSNQYPSQQAQPPYQFESQSPQYNSYSQPQTQQQQQHPYPEDYRGGSPGIITLRKEAPVNQKPAPVFTSQPAAVNYKGGTNMRGDLKWPPPEYKEQAARDNEERRQLALGPVCRPRKVKRDYTEFFAKNQLNSYYPGYKVPPGTQHMV